MNVACLSLFGTATCGTLFWLTLASIIKEAAQQSGRRRSTLARTFLELFRKVCDDIAVGLGQRQRCAHVHQLPCMLVTKALCMLKFFTHIHIRKKLIFPTVQVAANAFLSQTAERTTILR